MRRLYLDTETRSRTDLRIAGVYRYVEDDDFRVLMCTYAIDDGPVEVAVGHDEIRTRLAALIADRGVLKVAHHANFDRVSLSRVLLPDGCFLDPAMWDDSMALAAEWGYPRDLASLAKELGVAGKDEAGGALIKLFCVPRRDGGWNTSSTHPVEWQAFIDYGVQDTATLRGVYRALPGWPTKMERRIWVVDQLINDKGLRVDLELADAAAKAVVENNTAILARMRELSGADNPNSVMQLKAAIAQKWGLQLDTLGAQTLEGLLRGAPRLEPELRELLELRLESAGSAAKKYSRALESTCADGRLRGSFRFYGAHTGRWSGQGLQVQNLFRGQFDSETETCAAILDLKLGLGCTPWEAKALVRALFVGPMTVTDFSAIEARVIAWLAGEQWVLDAFEAGRDIYVETGARMGGLPRQQGKVAVLACLPGDSRILTDRGVIPLRDVTTKHRVWDGVEWVRHEGLVYRGKRKVINFGGLIATPDHLVWVEGQSRPVHFGLASESGSRLVQSGSGRTPLRLGRDHLTGAAVHAGMVGPVRVHQMHGLRKRELDGSNELDDWQILRMPVVQSTTTNTEVLGSSSDSSQAKVHQPSRRGVAWIRWPWDRVPLRLRYRSGYVGSGELGSPRTRDGVGSSRQRRALRARESTMGYPHGTGSESSEHPFVGVGSEVLALCTEHGRTQAERRQDSRGDHRGGGASCRAEEEVLADDSGAVDVYDLRNAGPRNRFTANNALVHNCGYSGSVGALRSMGAEGSDDHLKGLANQWRRANPRIVEWWAVLEQAFRRGGDAGPYVHVEPRGSDRYVWLPSGRALVYRDVRRDARTDRLSFMSHGQGSKRIDTYGGRLSENCLLGSTLVLTDRGWVRLDCVNPDDLVWDGVGFVSHQGLIKSGVRGTIMVDGAGMTPDHLVLTTEGWKSAEATEGLERPDVRLPDRIGRRRQQRAGEAPESRRDRGVFVRGAGRTEQVYDLANCGPRSRFVVKSDAGPMVVHNCTQAVARDILGEALVRLQHNGYTPILHAHDEAAVENGDPEIIERIFVDPPKWSTGLPLSADTSYVRRYRK